ncbi:MAG: hypothetical protein PHU08_06085, partial [Dehalococcoidales bacterium]|nr:hypothetical protein [Dehalococcoidales bacterium]
MYVTIRMAGIVLLLLAIYGLIIWGLTLALRRLGVPSGRVIVLGCLIFGGGMGLWVVRAWPMDSIMLINLPAVLAGDAIYRWTIQIWGNPASSQAHYTIPWISRIPQVYFLTSMVIWGILGLLAQLAHNRRHQI